MKKPNPLSFILMILGALLVFINPVTGLVCLGIGILALKL